MVKNLTISNQDIETYMRMSEEYQEVGNRVTDKALELIQEGTPLDEAIFAAFIGGVYAANLGKQSPSRWSLSQFFGGKTDD